MLTLYKGLFNTYVSNYYLFKDFNLFKQELEQYKVLQVDSNYYRMNDLHVVIDVDTTTINCYDLNYMIMEEQQIHKCYFINDFYFDNSGLHILLTLDLWGSAIDKAVLSNTNVYATNKFIGTGVYNDIKNVDYKKLSLYLPTQVTEISPNDLMCVICLNYNYNESIFSGSATSRTELMCVNVGMLKTLIYDYYKSIVPSITNEQLVQKLGSLNSIDLIVDIISGIDSIQITNTNIQGQETTKYNKCEVVRCYLIEKEFIKYDSNTTFILSTNYKYDIANYNFIKFNKVINSTKYKEEIIDNTYQDIILNNEIYVGTLLSYTKLTRFATHDKSIKFGRWVNVTNDKIEVLIDQSGTTFDITKSFAVDLTFNSANITSLEAINNQIKSFNSIVGGVLNVGGNIATKNYGKAVTGGIDIVTNVIDKATSLPRGQYVDSGDAIITYKGKGNDRVINNKIELAKCEYPLFMITYKSIDNEQDNLFTQGYNCNIALSISDVVKAPDYFIIHKVSDTLKDGFNTYIKAITNVSNVPLDYANYIKKVFANGVRLKVLGDY